MDFLLFLFYFILVFMKNTMHICQSLCHEDTISGIHMQILMNN